MSLESTGELEAGTWKLVAEGSEEDFGGVLSDKSKRGIFKYNEAVSSGYFALTGLMIIDFPPKFLTHVQSSSSEFAETCFLAFVELLPEIFFDADADADAKVDSPPPRPAPAACSCPRSRGSRRLDAAVTRSPSMSLLARCTRSGGTRGAVSFALLSRSYHGRSPAYRRLCTPEACMDPLYAYRGFVNALTLSASRPSSRLKISRPICPSLHRSRNFHLGHHLLKDQQRQEDIRDPPRSTAQDAGRADEDSPRESASERGQSEESADAKEKSEENGSGGRKDAEGDKPSSPPPPPPPHGDKTPWQVFTDTLKTEFEASKEWSESRKALASSANQIAESESLKRARAAYSAASEAASSTTTSALKTTGKAIGKSAAWTWETPVVKGVRAGVSATGKVIEKGTRPVRETEAYKKAVGEVKEVIDDGSSSRYGGWVDKEERKRLRELREMNEANGEGRVGSRAEKVEADPECVVGLPLRDADESP